MRTVLASFLFVDVVGFSKVPAAEQHAFKVALISVLQRGLAILSPQDYRLRDTGDGALISFLNDPEHALYMALSIAEDCGQPVPGQVLSLKNLRTGINLGTVRESMDVEFRPNFVGDGINAAQRIMDFAQPGQVTASRSYMEAVSLLDSAYPALFAHLGARADKHGRQHELFSITPDENVLEHMRRSLATERAAEPLDLDLDAVFAPAPNPPEPPAPSPAPTPAPPTEPAVVLAPPLREEQAQPAAATRTSTRAPLLWGLLAAAVVAGSGIAAIRMLDPQPGPAGPAPVAAPVAPPTAAPSILAAEPKADPAPPPAAVAPVAAAPAAAGPASVPQAAPAPVKSPVPAPTKAAVVPNPPAAPSAPPPAAVAAPSPPNPRCSRITQKASLGEPLTSDEQKELASSCR